MDLEFGGELWFWRGPAPWYFITVPEEECAVLRAGATSVSYGWGMIPVVVAIGDSEWSTSLFPKDGRYVVPVKAAVRRAERLDEGDTPTVRLRIRALLREARAADGVSRTGRGAAGVLRRSPGPGSRPAWRWSGRSAPAG